MYDELDEGIGGGRGLVEYLTSGLGGNGRLEAVDARFMSLFIWVSPDALRSPLIPT